MKTIAIKDFKLLEKYTKLIEKRLIEDLWDLIYKPLFKITRLKAANSSDIILDALKKNIIYYDGNGFKAAKKFNNKISSELILLGATYNKYEKKYIISLESLPDYLSSYITNSIKLAQDQLQQLNGYLSYVEMNLDNIIEEMVFDNEVGQILTDSENQLNKNLNIIELDISKQDKEQILATINKNFKVSKEEIEKNYTSNINKYTKKWLIEKIPEMRQKIQQAVLDGYRQDEVQTMLEKEYGIMERKAKFLAQNETSIMMAQLKKATYTEMGFTEFVWNTILDSKERPEHRKLNGKIFRFDNPPVIDERTGARGLPGETYNCRCSLTPIRRDSVFFNKEEIQRFQDRQNYLDIMQTVP